MWVLFAGALSLAGWLLSVFGGLNRGAYEIVVPLAAVLAWAGSRFLAPADGWRGGWRLRRFGRGWLPAGFAILWLLALAGGLLYPPNNIDALSYRIPRVLHWWTEGRWNWIATDNLRMNYSACGFEWLTAPWWFLFHDLRGFFLANTVGFALLPGLIFSLVRAAGARGRVARAAMWLVPCGLGYALQAGSVGNDLAGAVFVLAALYFANVARRKMEGGPLILSVLAIALATGVKTSNLLLVLPWAVVVWPLRKLLWRPAAVAATIFALGVSCLPTLVLNRGFAGDWSGDPANAGGLHPGTPLAGIAGNVLELAVQTAAPPVFPWAETWNRAAGQAESCSAASWLRARFPRFTLHTSELAQEEWAGLGLALAAWVFWLAGRRAAKAENEAGRERRRFAWALLLASALFCVLMASEMPARLLLPFYPLLLAVLLARAPAGAASGPVAQLLAAAAMASAFVCVIFNPSRPLWPAGPVCDWLHERFPGVRMVEKAQKVYRVYAGRDDPAAKLREFIPSGESRVGFIGTPDEPEISFWMPFGRRTVVTAIDPADLAAGGLDFIVGRLDALSAAQRAAIDRLSGPRGAFAEVARSELAIKASKPPETWVVWRRRSAPAATRLAPQAAGSSADFHEWAPRPPMGWNSWDCFGTTITEAQTMAAAEFLSANLKAYGWEYVVVDIQWYVPGAQGHEYLPDAVLTMDGFGRLQPAPNRFPSAADGSGFKALAARIHALGLKFGIHLMRGIPRQAVAKNLPVMGAGCHAADIADKTDVCPWNPDMYGVDMSKPGSQDYYDSVFGLLASWGVDYVKVDDIARPYHQREVEAIRRAIDRTGRPIVLSLSPGATPLDAARHLRSHANLWRISDDFWDRWLALHEQFRRLEQWNPHREAGAWPDADMLPLGVLDLGRRTTRFTRDEQRTLMTLWSIARSPLMYGGDPVNTDDFTLSLLNNAEVIAVDQNSAANRPLFDHDDLIAWTADVPGCADKYLAVFNARDPVRLTVENASYASPVITGETAAPVAIDVGVVGASRLFLVANPGEHGGGEALWQNPRLVFADGSVRPLTNFKWTGADATWDSTRVKNGAAGAPPGLAALAPAVIEYALPSEAVRFAAAAGFDPDAPSRDPGGSLRFLVVLAPRQAGNPLETLPVAVDLKDLGFEHAVLVRDLWMHRSLGRFQGVFAPEIPWHGAGLYRLSPR